MNTLQLYIKALNGEIELDQDSLSTLEEILATSYESNPDAFDAMASKLTDEEKKSLGAAGASDPTTGDGVDPRAAALQDLAALLGMGDEEAPGDTTADINRNRTQTGQENVARETVNRETNNTREVNNRVSNTVQNEVGHTDTSQNQTGQTVQTINERTRRYIEVPTAEEFMNEFSVGFATHLRRLGESGGANRMALNWAADNPQIFLNSYLGKLGDMAANGQNIYKLTGLDGKETYLGSREGQSSSTTNRETGSTMNQNAEAGSTTTSGANQQTNQGSRTSDSRQLTDQQTQQTEAVKTITDEIAKLVKGIGGTANGGAGVNQQQLEHMVDNLLSTMGSSLSAEERNMVRSNFSSADNERFSNTKNVNVTNTNRQNTDVSNTRNVKETEDLYARSRISEVFTLNPLDFMDNQWSGGDLTLQYEAFRRNGTQAGGGGPVQTRLVQ